MYLLIFAFVILLYTIAVQLVFERSFSDSLPFTCLGIPGVLYIFGLFDLLLLGQRVLLILLALSIVYVLKNYQKTFKVLSKSLFEIVIYFLFIIFIWWCHRGRLLSEWDEFSHWGLIVKNITLHDSFLYTPDMTTLFPGYPPSVSLFLYFAQRLCPSFLENMLYRSMNILLFSMLFSIPFVKSENKKSKLLLNTVIVFLIPLLFATDLFTSIYVDALLGVCFAFILISFYNEERFDLFFKLKMIVSFSFLTLAKSSGFGLAIIALLIIAFNVIRDESNKGKLTIKSNRIQILLLFLTTILVSNYSWDLFLSINNINEAWVTMGSLNLSNIISFINGSALSYQYQTIQVFFNAFAKYYIGNDILSVSALWWSVISFILFIFIHIGLNSDNRKRLKKAYSCLMIGFIIFEISLLILYIFTYSEYEALRVASFERYTSTYLISIYLVLIYYLFQADEFKWKFSKICITALLTLCLCFSNFNTIMNMTFLVKDRFHWIEIYRGYYWDIEEMGKNLGGANDRVYIISIFSNGGDMVVSRFLLTPVRSNINEPWSIGEARDSNDVWTKDITLEEWKQLLKTGEYTYVYIFAVNDYFREIYAGAFENPELIMDRALYKVEYTDDSDVILELVRE